MVKSKYKKKVASFIIGASIIQIVTAKVLEKEAKKTTYVAKNMVPVTLRHMGFYEKFIKRGLDIACATGAIVCFAPLYAVIAILVKVKLGSPILFTQERPGLIDESGKETIFKMYKFRTMTSEKDENGELLPDKDRLTEFGKWLRSTSLDELPEAINILNGTMSVVGPRPQLVRDMTFMTTGQRRRHTAKPGLSGLAQVNGRNNIDWMDKLNWDIKYIDEITAARDIKIVIKTIEKAFISRDGITEGDMATAEDYGDYLFRNSKITKETYNEKIKLAKEIMKQ